MNDRMAIPANLDRRGEQIGFHPLAGIFPLIDGDDYEALVADIAAHGLHEPIILHDGQILDGRNRYRACLDAGIPHRFELYTGTDALGYVVSLNLRRRHLNESQRAMVAAKIANMPAHRPDNKSANLQTSQADAAKLLNVSTRSVASAVHVAETGAPELVHAVESGAASVSAAAEVATLTEPEQQEIVAKGDVEIVKAAAKIRAKRTEENKAVRAAVKAKNVIIPEGRHGCIVIDPPWPMQKIDRDVRPNQVGFDYPVMSLDEIQNFGSRWLRQVAADDCHLFTWTTQKFLPAAIYMLDHWGFNYVLTMVWHKPGGFQPIGLPQYNCEFVVYARRGSPAFLDTKAFPCCFHAPRREHSRKPDEFYALIERVTAGPRIDIFSREPRDGFAQLGNETEKFAGAA